MGSYFCLIILTLFAQQDNRLQNAARQLPMISLWDGTFLYIPQGFSEIQLLGKETSAYLYIHNPEKHAAIFVIKEHTKLIDQKLLKEITKNFAKIEPLLTPSDAPPEKEGASSENSSTFQVASQIYRDKIYFFFCPQTDLESELSTFLYSIHGPDQKTNLDMEFPVWQTILTLVIFAAFLLFILVSLKSFSKLALNKSLY